MLDRSRTKFDAYIYNLGKIETTVTLMHFMAFSLTNSSNLIMKYIPNKINSAHDLNPLNT